MMSMSGQTRLVPRRIKMSLKAELYSSVLRPFRGTTLRNDSTTPALAAAVSFATLFSDNRSR